MNDKISNGVNLDQKNIIALLGIENLSDERKVAILDKMTDLLQKRLMARMLTALNEQGQEEFATVLEKNNPKETQSFISNHFPQFQDWLVEEVNALKQELVDFVGKR